MMNNCTHCHNTGTCKFCHGTGKNMNGTMNCIHCNGTGVCKFCQGRSASQGQPQSQHRGGGFNTQQPPIQGHFAQAPPVPEQPDFTKMNAEEILEYFMKGMSGGKLGKKLMGINIRGISKYNMGVSKISIPLWEKLSQGSIKDQMVCAEIVGYMGEGAGGMFNQVATLLSHQNALVREAALNALDSLGELATAVEEKIIAAESKEPERKLKKKLSKLLKKLSKVSPDRKELILLEETEKRLLLEDVKEREENSKTIDTSKLGQATNEFSQFKNIFFMSHALPDFQWVEKAIAEISSWPGCYCWTCERDISPGEDWLTEIYNGLDACNWYVLFWSDKAENSKWTNEEMREAKTRNVASGKPKVSIVNLGKQEWPRLLSRHQGAVVTTDEELQGWLENLKVQVEL